MHLNLTNKFLVIAGLLITNLTASPLTQRAAQKFSISTKVPVTASSQKLLSPTAPLVFKRLALRNPDAFKSLCSSIFGTTLLLNENDRVVHHRPYIPNPKSKDAFFNVYEPAPEEDEQFIVKETQFTLLGHTSDGIPQFLVEQKLKPNAPPITLATEIQFSFEDLWSNISGFNTAPKSDSNHPTSVYNVVTDPTSKLDRTIIFGSQDTSNVSAKNLRVTQVGLGAERLRKSTDPETQAWLEFLTKSHTSLTSPTNIPAVVASAYPALKMQNRNGSHAHPVLSPYKREVVEIMIGFFKSEGFSLATMVKQTGLSKDQILKIIQKLK
jgi:hypothetical protein